MTVSPSAKDACLFHPGNGDAKTKCKSAVDIVGKTQRELNFSSSISSSSSSSVVVVVVKQHFDLWRVYLNWKINRFHKSQMQTLHSGTYCDFLGGLKLKRFISNLDKRVNVWMSHYFLFTRFHGH